MPHKHEEEGFDEEEEVDYFAEKEETQDASILPLVTFGLLTDVQYADVEDGWSYDKKRQRFYRNSLNLVKEAVRNWKEHEINFNTKFKFIIQLGDIIDAKSKSINDAESAMQRVINELNKLFKKMS